MAFAYAVFVQFLSLEVAAVLEKKVSDFCVSKVSGQDDQGSGEAPAKEVGKEVYRQKSQPGESTKFGRQISKCRSGTRSTNAHGQDPRRGLCVLKNINRKKVNMVGTKIFWGKTGTLHAGLCP